MAALAALDPEGAVRTSVMHTTEVATRSWTIDEMLAARPCSQYDRARITELWTGRDSLTLLEILDLSIPDSDKVWVCTRQFWPEWITEVVTRAVTRYAAPSTIPEVRTWAARWLSGTDRSEAAAAEAAAAAAATAAAAAWATAAAAAWAAAAATAWAAAEAAAAARAAAAATARATARAAAWAAATARAAARARAAAEAEAAAAAAAAEAAAWAAAEAAEAAWAAETTQQISDARHLLQQLAVEQEP
jgi:hypothetical protein